MMTPLAAWRRSADIATLLACTFAPAGALVKFNDGHDSIFVTGTVGVGYDSNLFASANSDGDYSYNAALEIEYQRKAGMLGVNGSLGWDFSKYQDFSSEDFANPHARLELTKDAGRTTGSVTASAARETRADSAINLRTTSWEYETGLNVKYPVIERYTLAGQIAYSRRDFEENFALVDINTWSLGSDLFYVYTSQRDILAGYRFRVTDTTAGTHDYDHAFTLGTTGKILPTINGTARVGYQRRLSRRSDGTRENFDGITSTVSATWSAFKRLNVTGQINSDFNTVATDVSVSTLSAGLDAQYALTARFSVFSGAGVGRSRFLGARGDGRSDTYFTYNAGVAYTLNDHFKATLSYVHFQNWSTLAFSDYTRRTISLNLSSRW